jgi:hypothetical protein
MGKNGFVAERFDKLAYAVAGQRVIIDNRNQWEFGHRRSPNERLVTQ